MPCARCPSTTPITVLQSGIELCRRCADLPADRPDSDAKTENAPPKGGRR